MTSKPILSILIPTLPDRSDFLNRLMENLDHQLTDQVMVIMNDEVTPSTGAKRNELLKYCTTPYCVFIDDDDLVSDDYIKAHLDILNSNSDVDGIGFKGIITADGRSPFEFIHKHGLPYTEDRSEGRVKYLRPLNHLNVVRTEIARKIGYPDKTFAEDYDYCQRLADSGLIKTAEFIDQTMYYYLYRTTK